MELISQRAYGRSRGMTHTAVQEAVKFGRIPTHAGPRGWRWINPDEADRAMAENTDPSAPRNRLTGTPEHRRDPNAPSTPMDLDARPDRPGGNGGDTGDGGNGKAATYSKARAAREVYSAQMAKLRLDVELGLLVSAEEVRLAAFNLARQTRDQLIAIPERVSAVLAATEDVGEVQRILNREIERVCEELSGADAERN